MSTQGGNGKTRVQEDALISPEGDYSATFIFSMYFPYKHLSGEFAMSFAETHRNNSCYAWQSQ